MFNDLNKFLKNISDSDVVSIVFFNLNVSLVIDRRISEGNVLIKIFPIASSADNRIKILNNLRPDLKEVKNFQQCLGVQDPKNILNYSNI